MLLAQKWMPKKIHEIAGNEESKARIRQWMLNWLRGVRQKPLLIHGPPGTGKTTMAYALKTEYDLELVEMNASELRNAESVERILGVAGGALSLSGKKKIILIDDVDALFRDDRGGSAAIAAVLRNSEAPIILTAGDAWDRKIASIRAEAQLVEFKRISKSSVQKVLEKICDGEGMNVDKQTISSIAENCNGDIRSAINDLQTGMSGMRDREMDIFERMKTIFKSTTYAEARAAAFGDIEHDFLKLWVDENIPLEYEIAPDCANAYSALSRADVFDARITRRQYWGFLRYSGDLISAGVALSKKQKYFKFVRYQFPTYLRQMSASSARRAMQREVGHKIGVRTHCSWKEALEYIHVVRHILTSRPDAMDFYRLDEEEAAFLMDMPVAAIKERFSLGKKKKDATDSERRDKKENDSAAREKKEQSAEQKSRTPEAKKSTLNDFL